MLRWFRNYQNLPCLDTLFKGAEQTISHGECWETNEKYDENIQTHTAWYRKIINIATSLPLSATNLNRTEVPLALSADLIRKNLNLSMNDDQFALLTSLIRPRWALPNTSPLFAAHSNWYICSFPDTSFLNRSSSFALAQVWYRVTKV